MPVVFDSGLLDFAEDETQYVEVVHGLGKCPNVIQFYGELDGNLGFPQTLDEHSNPLPGPYLTETTNHNVVRAHKPDTYEFAGKFRILIIDN
jgi:hypothetical protein